MGKINNSFKLLNIKILTISFLIIAGIFYSILWKSAPFMADDSGGYIKVASDLQNNLTLTNIHHRSPGYPLLLWLTNSVNHHSTLLFYTQLVLHLIAVFLLSLLLSRYQVSSGLILIFLLLSLSPPSIEKSAYLLAESGTEFCLVVGAVLLIAGLERGKALMLVISGISFAYAALFRPTYQLLFIAILGAKLAFIPIYKKNIKRLALASISIAIPTVILVGGLVWFNYQNFNFLGLTSVFGFSLSTKTGKFLERLPDEYADIREILIASRNSALVARNGGHTGEMYIWQAIPSLEQITGLNRPELSKYMATLNLMLIKEAPLTYLLEVAHAMSAYWFPATTDLANFNSRYMQLCWGLLHFIVITLFFMTIGLALSFGITLAILRTKIKKTIFLFNDDKNIHAFLSFIIALTVIFYTMLISTIFEVGNPRYRTPTDLFIYFVITLGFHFSFQIRKHIASTDIYKLLKLASCENKKPD